MMKLAVFTVMLPEYDLEEAAKLLAKHGYEGVEWRVKEVDPDVAGQAGSFWGNNRATVDLNTLAEKAAEIRDLTTDAGLEMCNLATYLKVDQLAEIEMVMQAAQVMGAPSLRVGVPNYDRSTPYDELFDQAREALGKVQKLARKYGIKAVTELHMNNMTPSASASRRLLEAFDPNYIGAIYDPGNMIYEGYEQWLMGMQILGPYLAHVHAKNSKHVIVDTDADGVVHWQTVAAPMKEGRADWAQIIADLKAFGYDGFISFEDFSELPTEDKLASNAAYLRELIG